MFKEMLTVQRSAIAVFLNKIVHKAVYLDKINIPRIFY